MVHVRNALDTLYERGIRFAQSYSLPLLVFKIGEENRELATGSFVRTGDGVFLTTAKHVIERLQELGGDGRLQIGGQAFVLPAPLPENVRHSQYLDLAMIEMDEVRIAENRWNVLELTDISIKPVQQYDLVTYCGFPGDLKNFSGPEKSLRTFNFCGVVDTVEPDQFSMRVDKQRFDSDIDLDPPMFSLGGISGAPIFSVVDINDGRIRRPFLVGWIHEGIAWSELTQKHYAVPAFEVLNWFGLR